MKIGVSGAGNVGGELGRLWAAGGHQVTFGARDPAEKGTAEGVRVATIADAASPAEVVVLAVPWGAAREALAAAGDLSGTVLIDATNPLGPGLTLATGDLASGAEQIAAWAVGARVVKAFNSTGWNNFEQPQFGGQRASMLLCGDDAAARATVAQLAGAFGFEPVDCGPLANARHLESLALLWIWLAINGNGRDIAFALLRR